MAAGSDRSGSRGSRQKRQSAKLKDAPLTRSENMSRIRSRDTGPELTVRRAFWKAGLRYRLYDKQLPGSPDIVFPGRRTVVFVHGCFWHCHEGCINFRIPKTRTEWWYAKLMRNKARDAETRAKLEAAGWRVIVIWECEVACSARLSTLIQELSSVDYSSC